MCESPHLFSCTSVHTSYPQGAAQAYRLRGAELARYRQSSTIAIHSSTNDLWKTFLLRFASGFSRLPSPPTAMSPLDAFFLPRTHQCTSPAAQLHQSRSKMHLDR